MIAQWLECQTVDQEDNGSSPSEAISKFGQFHSPQIACVFQKNHHKPLVPSK